MAQDHEHEDVGIEITPGKADNNNLAGSGRDIPKDTIRRLEFNDKWIRFFIADKQAIGIRAHVIPDKGWRTCLARQQFWKVRELQGIFDVECCPMCRASMEIRGQYGWNVCVYEDINPETGEPKDMAHLSDMNFQFYLWRIKDYQWKLVEGAISQTDDEGKPLPHHTFDLVGRLAPGQGKLKYKFELHPKMGKALYLRDKTLTNKVAQAVKDDQKYDVKTLMTWFPNVEDILDAMGLPKEHANKYLNRKEAPILSAEEIKNITGGGPVPAPSSVEEDAAAGVLGE